MLVQHSSFTLEFSYVLCNPLSAVVCSYFSASDSKSEHVSRACGLGATLQGDLVGTLGWRDSNIHAFKSSFMGFLRVRFHRRESSDLLSEGYAGCQHSKN